MQEYWQVGDIWTREQIAEMLHLAPTDPRLTDGVCEWFTIALWDYLAEKALGDRWDETMEFVREQVRRYCPSINDRKIEEMEM